MNKLLIIDDSPEILEANRAHLTDEGFDVTAADTGIKAIAALSENQFDCIVLDILLPDLDGYAICKAARTVTNAPIIFLTCMDDMDDKLKGLIAGGDDYMTKPYSLKELTARVRALIRRGEMKQQPENSDFYIDRHNRMIHTNEKNVFLSEKEFELFMLFYEHPNTLLSKEEILNKIWRGSKADSGTVAVHILKLRRKLAFAQQFIGFIENGYGAGYRLIHNDVEGEV